MALSDLPPADPPTTTDCLPVEHCLLLDGIGGSGVTTASLPPDAEPVPAARMPMNSDNVVVAAHPLAFSPPFQPVTAENLDSL